MNGLQIKIDKGFEDSIVKEQEIFPGVYSVRANALPIDLYDVYTRYDIRKNSDFDPGDNVRGPRHQSYFLHPLKILGDSELFLTKVKFGYDEDPDLTDLLADSSRSYITFRDPLNSGEQLLAIEQLEFYDYIALVMIEVAPYERNQFKDDLYIISLNLYENNFEPILIKWFEGVPYAKYFFAITGSNNVNQLVERGNYLKMLLDRQFHSMVKKVDFVILDNKAPQENIMGGIAEKVTCDEEFVVY